MVSLTAGKSGSSSPSRWLLVARRGFAASWLVVLLIAVWEVVARLSQSVFFPPVSTIATAFREDWLSGPPARVFLSDTLLEHLAASMWRMAAGWGVAVVVGVGAGIAIGLYAPLRASFGPSLRFLMSVPASTLLPIAIGIFGITDRMNASLIAFATVWTILVNTTDGVASVDPVIRMSAKSMRLRRRAMFFKVILPSASPQIFAGIRVSLGITLAVMVIGELYAATDGIGYFVAFADRRFDYPSMWGGVFLIALIGILLNVAFAVLERKVLGWHRRQRQLSGS